MKDKKMKLTQFTSLLILGLVLAVAGSGCRKRPTALTPLPGARTGTPGDVGPGNALEDASKIKPEDTFGIASNPPGSHQGWNENTEVLKADTVHFDYDSSVVKAGEKPKVAAVADYLKGNRSSAVKIEGHCDERGTEEYNRALGERRALALREELARLGIDPGRVDTISYGKDRPVDTGRDESAHRKNRRGEFVVLTPPGT
jgi:peptidoglycan-associated lipoprotein